MLNGTLTAELTDAKRSPILGAVADAPFLDTKGRVESLFLAALGRRPTDREREIMTGYVVKGGSDGDARKALSDVLWVLLNSSEFNTNH